MTSERRSGLRQAMVRRSFVLPAVMFFVWSASCSSGSGIPAVNGPTATQIELIATEMRYTPSSVAVAAGQVPVILHNKGLVIHDVRVEKETAPRLYLEAAPGQTSTTTWQVSKGRYRIFCALSGHRAAGMEGVLEVR